MKNPIRLEPVLSRDFIDKAEKMRSLEYRAGQVISPSELLGYWLLFGIMVTACMLVWWLQ